MKFEDPRRAEPGNVRSGRGSPKVVELQGLVIQKEFAVLCGKSPLYIYCCWRKIEIKDCVQGQYLYLYTIETTRTAGVTSIHRIEIN